MLMRSLSWTRDGNSTPPLSPISHPLRQRPLTLQRSFSDNNGYLEPPKRADDANLVENAAKNVSFGSIEGEEDREILLGDVEERPVDLESRWHTLRQLQRENDEALQRRARRVSPRFIDDALEVLESIVFNYLLSVSIIWQLTLVIFVRILQPDAFVAHTSVEVDVALIVWLGQAIQLLFLILAVLDAAKRVRHGFVPLGDLLRLYTANSFAFAGLYYACFLSNAMSFRADLNGATDPFEVYLVFLYFSIGTQGTAGFGDVVPISLTAQSVASVQMLASVIYSVSIFVVGTAHICMQREEYERRRQRALSFMQDSAAQPEDFADGLLDAIERQAPLIRYWRDPMKKKPLLVTVAVLGFNLTIVYMADDDINVATATQIFLGSVVLITQSVQVMVVFVVSISLVRKIESEEVTSGFLAQSYLSTAIVFSGMYFAIFLVQGPESWNLVDDKVEKNLTLAGMILHFLYFSITTQTSCGYGDFYPRTTPARIMVCIHMLVSMSYSAVVLGLGMSHLVDKIPTKHELQAIVGSRLSSLRSVRTRTHH